MTATDMSKVIDVAIAFANLPIEPDDKFPFLVSHPFVNSPMTIIPTKSGQEMVNVMEKDGEQKFKDSVIKRLKKSKNPIEILFLLNKPYYFTFLDHIQKYLSDDDLGGFLRSVWEYSEYTNEYTNTDAVLTKEELVKLFRRSTKNKLMDKEELDVLKKLPERLTIYRGTTTVNSKDVKVFSWTLSRNSAEWYAQRFDDDVQNIFQAELPKDGVLAYFSTDEEIIADPYQLENIQLIETLN